MAEEINKVTKRGWKRLLPIFGVRSDVAEETADGNVGPNSMVVPSGTFSTKELGHLPGFIKKDNKANVKDLEKAFEKTSSNIAKHSADINAFKALTPEIDKARSILIPSIMSPNDVQIGNINIIVDDPSMDKAVATKLGEMLTEYFNGELRLGTNIARWAENALFKHGAQPVLILQKKPLTLMSDVLELEAELAKKGERLTIGVENLEHLDFNVDDIDASFESFNISETITNEAGYVTELTDELRLQFADDLEGTGISAEKLATKASEQTAKLLDGSKDIISFSTDYRSLVAPKDKKSELTKGLQKRINESIYGEEGSRMFVASDEGDVSEGDHPALVPLPAEAVIPVAIPGSPEEHIGYFILSDVLGNPIKSVMSADEQQAACSKEIMSGGVNLIYGGSFNHSALTKQKEFDTASSVFGVVVKKMLEGKLRDNGLEGITVDQHQAIMTTMFHRLIRKAKMRIIFVPAPLLAYYAFDYRPDGTGKTMLEDNEFLFTLRNTLVVAKVMSALKNAIERTRIEFNVGEQANNVDQVMEVIKSSFVDKRMPKFSNNPVTSARNLVEQSVSILPQGLRGMENFNVTTEPTQSGTSSPDDETMETLKNFTTLSMKVPPAALNELGENEYSRSVATTNLFFSNEIRMMQMIVNDITTPMVRMYTQSSKSLITKIIDILKLDDTKVSKKEAKTGDPEGTVVDDKDGSTSDNVMERVFAVINNVRTTLPSPAVAANKAQFEEMREIIEIVDTLVEKLYDEELIGIDDSKMKDAYMAMRAYVRQCVLREMAAKMGPHGSINIPGMDEIDPMEIGNFQLNVKNLQKQFDHIQEALKAPGAEDDEDGYGGY